MKIVDIYIRINGVIYIYICGDIYIYIYMHICIYTGLPDNSSNSVKGFGWNRISGAARTHRHTYTGTLTQAHLHSHTYTGTLTLAHLHSHTYTRTLTLTHLHSHTYTHTYTYTPTPPGCTPTHTYTYTCKSCKLGCGQIFRPWPRSKRHHFRTP